MATLNEHTSVLTAILSEISDRSDINFI